MPISASGTIFITSLSYVLGGQPQAPTMIDTPLQFTPILVPKVWGGRRLAALGKNLPPDATIGESWELADLPGEGPCSIVAEGPLAGTTLRELLDTHQPQPQGLQ